MCHVVSVDVVTYADCTFYAVYPYTYNCTFPAMIDDWREKWYTFSLKQTDSLMGFGFVQVSAHIKIVNLTF